jgi:hypothetical protein
MPTAKRRSLRICPIWQQQFLWEPCFEKLFLSDLNKDDCTYIGQTLLFLCSVYRQPYIHAAMHSSLALTSIHANHLLTGSVDHLKIVCCNPYVTAINSQPNWYKDWPTFFARAVRACSPNILSLYRCMNYIC